MRDLLAVFVGFALLAVAAKLFSHVFYDGGMMSEAYIYITFIAVMLVRSEIAMYKIRNQLEEIKAKQ